MSAEWGRLVSGEGVRGSDVSDGSDEKDGRDSPSWALDRRASVAFCLLPAVLNFG